MHSRRSCAAPTRPLGPLEWQSISVTGYAIQGGADQDKLSITSSGGVLTLRTAGLRDAGRRGEHGPADAAGNNEYVVVRATSGTARAVADYTATSGTLTFAPGETSKTIAVTTR